MKKVITDGNGACAHIAYMLNDLAVIYPITPSSNISEICDTMQANNNTNIFGNKLRITQMQSEAGVAGAVHGALTAGSLTTTFTSSQGLLLMLPNMYKIAGELKPTVFYVAARSLATHALNIYCDYSDIYSCLKTGFNVVCCNTVQEVNDMAIACTLASLKSSTPFVCFFDGFRTSHELNTIEQSTLEEVKSIVDFEDIKKFKSSAINSVNPYVQGTNQNPDVFFQNRVASLKYYNNVLDVVKNAFNKTQTITNRKYNTIEYFGSKSAENIVISMGSSVEVLKLAQKKLKNTGVINVRMLKPFDEKTFLKILPKTAKNITVLERNLDVNGVDTLTSLVSSCLYKNKILLNIYSGVYGLGGKEFTPDMALACFNNMTQLKKQYFTVGIDDDQTNTSLPVVNQYIENNKDINLRIYGYGSDGSVSSAKNILKIIGENTSNHTQGYFDYDSKKSGSLTISHLRISTLPINKPYNSNCVNVVLCNNPTFLTKYDMTNCLKQNGTFLINSPYSEKALNDIMPTKMKEELLRKNITVYNLDAYNIASKHNLNTKINTIMQTALFKLFNIIDFKSALNYIEQSIISSYSKKGEEVVKNNINAINEVENAIKKIKINCSKNKSLIQNSNCEYFNQIISPINNQMGNSLKVGAFDPAGKMPTNTTKLEKRGVAMQIPEWISEKCIQCGRCSIMCPHACLKAVEFKKDKTTPKSLQTRKSFTSDKEYRLQVSPLDCTGCGVCSEVCPVKAILMNKSAEHKSKEIENLKYVETLNCEVPASNTVKTLQFKPNYFEFSGACAGCGETPYLKLVTQLFGDRMIIANATGCSSIYGGTFPTCPYAKDKNNMGPGWANSLFEDNAEFGYGIAHAKTIERQNFIKTLNKNLSLYSKKLIKILKQFVENNNDHNLNKEIVLKLSEYQKSNKIAPQEQVIFNNLHLFIKPSCWIIGGDGWAYDIGFGGLDHVVATGENVNILILDTELYSNTGGQTSKSTPRGSTAKFNSTGKTTMKKDILAMLKSYKNVYLAQVAMGANPDQCIKAFEEAEAFDGPSVILAYSPCINHGYDMRYSQTHVLNSVKSGYNTLFRYSPNFEQGTIIDSYDPTLNYNEFLESENRYKILSKFNPEQKEHLLNQNKLDAENRRKNLKN